MGNAASVSATDDDASDFELAFSTPCGPSESKENTLLTFDKPAATNILATETPDLPTVTMKSSSKNQNVDIHEAIVLIQQIKQSASPDQLLALQRVLQPASPNIVPPSPNVSQPSAKPARPDALTRRRSSFLPGIATRDKSNKLQKRSPSIKSPADQTWSPDMFCQSPLSKLAGWESKDDGLIERAATPDIDHSYLGAHALGSLRVTNGVASPAPSIYSRLVSKQSASSLRNDDHYYTASEGSGRDSPAKLSDQNVHSPGQSGVSAAFDPATTEEVLVGERQSVPQPHSPQPGAPLVQVISSSPTPKTSRETLRNCESLQVSEDCPLARSASVLKPYQYEAESNPFLEAEAASNDEPTTEQAYIISPNLSPLDTLYQAEANSNPFLGTERDEHFEPGAAAAPETPFDSASCQVVKPHFQMAPQSLPYLISKQYSRSDDTSFTKALPASAASSIYTSGSRREARAPKTWQDYDSGYSSQGSIQTSRDTLLMEKQPAEDRPEQTAVNDVIVFHTESTSPRSNQCSANVTFCSNKTLDISKPLPQDPPRPSLTILTQSPRAQSSPLLPSQPIPASDSSNTSPRSKKEPKKLQKKRRQSKRMSSEPVVVQSQAQTSSSLDVVPQIPTEVADRHIQRMNQHPDMNSLNRTYKSVSHEGSPESAHSNEPFNVHIRFPSPERSTFDQDTKGKGSRNRRSSSFGGEQIQSLFRRSGGGSRSRSHTVSQGIAIADFGTVTGALGASPYDLATAETSREPRGRIAGPRAMTQPYQMSSRSSRSKSAVGMTDEMASKFAMQRSRDRHEDWSLGAEFQSYSRERVDQDPDNKSRANREYRSRSSYGARPALPKPSGERKPPRPRSMHSTSAPESENTASFSKPEDGELGPTAAGKITPEALSAARPLQNVSKSKDELDWSQSAKAWSMRRKSIGENLLKNNGQDSSSSEYHGIAASAPERPHTSHSRSTPTMPSRPPPAVPIEPNEQVQPQWDASTPRRDYPDAWFSPDVQSTNPARSSSPTPSVLERAAAYERSINEQTSPDRRSPTRPLQPPHRRPLPPRALQETPPFVSKFSTSVSPTHSPSGVASAYALSKAVFSPPDRQPPMPVLSRPPSDLSPTKRTYTSTRRKAVPVHGPHPSYG